MAYIKKMRSKITIILVIVSTSLNAQFRFPNGIQLNRNVEVTDFTNDINGFPLIRTTDGLINNWIHSDSIVLQSQIKNLTGELLKITENSKTGWRLKGFDELNYGDIGTNAVDLSISNTASSVNGAIGDNSFAIGLNTSATGNNSFSFGENIISHSYGEIAIGYFGTNYTANSTTTANDLDRIFYIGNGTDDANRNDALIVLKSGKITAPSLSLAEVDTNESLTTKEYVDNVAVTNLSYTASPTNGIVTSSTGTDATIPVVDNTNAGLLKPDFYNFSAFTPTLTGGTYTINSTTGSAAIRAGNLVYLTVKLENINGTGSGVLQIGNLPFTPSTGVVYYGIVGTFFGSTYATPKELVADLSIANSTIRFKEMASEDVVSSYIQNIDFTSGEIIISIVYMESSYTH